MSALKAKYRKADIPNFWEIECGLGLRVTSAHEAWRRTMRSGERTEEEDDHKPIAIL
jgi:hypothetical protein